MGTKTTPTSVTKRAMEKYNDITTTETGHCPCSRNVTRTHEYFADPVRLYHIVCRYGCGSCRDYSHPWNSSSNNHNVDDDENDDKPEPKSPTHNMTQHLMVTYLQARRKTKRVFGLLSMASPLEVASAKLFNERLQACGLSGITSMPHLVLAEGLWPNHQRPHSELDTLRQAVRQYPTITIRKIIDRIIPARPSYNSQQQQQQQQQQQPPPSTVMANSSQFINKARLTRRIVVANVSVHDTVQHAIDKLVLGDGCFLPPFPLHVTLGCTNVCGREQNNDDNDLSNVLSLADKHLIGMTLTITGDRIRILAPIDFEAWSPWYEVDENDYGVAESKNVSTLKKKLPEKPKTLSG